MDYCASWYDGDLQYAIKKCKPGDNLVVDLECLLLGTLIIEDGVTLRNKSRISGDGKNVTVHLAGDGSAYIGGSITGSGMAAVMATGAGCRIKRLTAEQYNLTNQNGQAAIFGYNATDLLIRECVTRDGNGNGIRLQSVDGALISKNGVSKTAGNSAEGVTFNNSRRVRFFDNAIDRAFTSGMLVFGSAELIEIVGNWISNSSQDPAGSHPAIGLNANGALQTGLVISANAAFDNQLTHTQRELLAVSGAGRICGKVFANNQWGCLVKDQFVVNNGATADISDLEVR